MCTVTRGVAVSMLYPLVYPSRLSLIRFARQSDKVVSYAAPLYYYRKDENQNCLSLGYIVHPRLSVLYNNVQKVGSLTRARQRQSPYPLFERLQQEGS